MAFLRLFHGRKNTDEEMNGWGEPGPTFGPFPFFHTTYNSDIKFDEHNGFVLEIVDGLVFYDGWYYGDWTLIDRPDPGDQPELFDPTKAALPRGL